MSKTIELTEEQWAALQSGEDVTIKAPKPAKWEPAGGRFVPLLNGYIRETPVVTNTPNLSELRRFGAERATREQAERARQIAHEALIIDAYVAEHAPDYIPNWNDCDEKKRFVFFHTGENEFMVGFTFIVKRLGVTYMPKEIAEQLAADLNSGRVDLKYKEA